MAQEQIRYSFDAKSLQKMGKGMLYAIAPAVIMGVIAFLQDAKWESGIVGAVMPFIIMLLSNGAKEWVKGMTPEQAEIKAMADKVVADCVQEVKDARTVGGAEQAGVDKTF